MSADRWTFCPKCRAEYDKRQQESEDRVAQSYGKVPLEKYEAMKLALKNEDEFKESMREDWELGTDDGGQFTVSYTCWCNTCKFKFTFEHTQSVLDSARRPASDP